MFYFILDSTRLLAILLDVFPKKESEIIKRMLVELARVNGS